MPINIHLTQTGSSFSEDEIYSLLAKQSEYMNKRFDCADFRAQMLFKISKDCRGKLSERCRKKSTVMAANSAKQKENPIQ